MRRERIGNELLTVQEVDEMHIVRIYATADDFTKYISSKLSEEEQKKFEDYKWFPIRVEVENDMTVDFTLAAINK